LTPDHTLFPEKNNMQNPLRTTNAHEHPTFPRKSDDRKEKQFRAIKSCPLFLRVVPKRKKLREKGRVGKMYEK